MEIKVALVSLACPVEVGYDEALPLLNATDKAMKEYGVTCENTGVVMHDLDTVRQAAEKLKGTEFDDKVGELSLDDLKIASELDVPIDSIESWEELLALIQKVKDETLNGDEIAILRIKCKTFNLNNNIIKN